MTRMSDSISRQAAIDAVKKNTFRLTFAEEQNCEGHVTWSACAVYSDVIKGALLELPTVDAVPVRHGKWEEHKDYPGLAYLCSECGYFTTMPKYHYCPYCGARME